MDVTWPDSVLFACPCGVFYAVRYWRWIDAAERPDLVESVGRDGPFEGVCRDCGRLARAMGTWLHIDRPAAVATLMISQERRGAITSELREHLTALDSRLDSADTWLLQPRMRFVELADPTRVHRRTAPEARSGELIVGGPPPLPRSGVATPATRVPTGPIGVGVPQLIGTEARGSRPVTAKTSNLGGWVGDLETTGEGRVLLRVTMPIEDRQNWAEARLRARPVLLRDYGYPLCGVRIFGAFMGQVGCLDGLIDLADPRADHVRASLSRKFELDVRFGGEDERDGVVATRSVGRSGLEANVQLCFVSGQALMSRNGQRSGTFSEAREQLTQTTLAERLETSNGSIAEGAYQHIMSASEAASALEHLDRMSRKEHLATLLEVQGFPVGEYHTLRRRVLAGSLEYGLVAPRRFWRRVIGSGLATDLQDYARRLAEHRATFEGEEGDLSPDRAREAWQGILDLCQRKGLETPDPLMKALDRLRDEPQEATSLAQREGVEGRGLAELRRRLRDPAERLSVASDVLQGRTAGPLDLVFEVLDDFEVDELLAVLPDLSDIGSRAVPGLIGKLNAPRREIRQAATILLGLALDPSAQGPLIEHLLSEETEVWLDLARAVGSFGASAVPGLCETLQPEPVDPGRDPLDRVARALAEIALSDGKNWPDTTSASHQAVVSLTESADPRVSAAGRRALATLRDVSEFGAITRGELPPPEHSIIRRFARRAYEAIMIPELEVEVEA